MKEFLLVLLFLIVFAIVGTIELVPEERPIREQVQDYIEHCGIVHADVVMKQAVLETGNFNSRLFTEDNNLFGMKYAYNRPTTAIGMNDNGSAIYHNWQHSVIDYMLFQQKYYKGGDYYKFLKRCYAEDTLYTRKLRRTK